MLVGKINVLPEGRGELSIYLFLNKSKDTVKTQATRGIKKQCITVIIFL